MPHFNDADFPQHFPEELKEQYRRQFMKEEDAVNTVVDFLRGLTVEQLLALQLMLNNLTDTTGGPASAAHYLGWVNGALQFKYNRCHMCGRDHTDELLAGVNPHPAPEHNIEVIQRVAGDEIEIQIQTSLNNNLIDDTYPYPPGIEPHLTVLDTKNLVEYNLDARYAESLDGKFKFAGFGCKTCGLYYPSIEDRMLKAPDTCGGCQHKSKWG